MYSFEVTINVDLIITLVMVWLSLGTLVIGLISLTVTLTPTYFSNLEPSLKTTFKAWIYWPLMLISLIALWSDFEKPDVIRRLHDEDL